jgi:hypothetical protein
MNHEVTIAILTPSCRDPKWDFKNAQLALNTRLLQAMAPLPIHWLGGKRITNFEFRGRLKTSLLPQGRQKLLDEAIDDGFDYALWWDDDVAASPDALGYLLSRNVASVAANVLCKGIPDNKEKFPDDGIWYSAAGEDGKPISSLGKTGTEKCYAAGMAYHLVHLPSIKPIPRPHFEVRWNEQKQDYAGEDWFFVRKLADAGIPTIIDHDASMLCSHIGDWHYNINNMAMFMKSGKAIQKLMEMMQEKK